MQNAWNRINKAMKNIQNVILTEDDNLFIKEKNESLKDECNKEETKKELNINYRHTKWSSSSDIDNKNTTFNDEKNNIEKIYTKNVLYDEIISNIDLFNSFIKNEKAQLYINEYKINYYNSEEKEFFLLNFICICKYTLFILTKFLNINLIDKFEYINMNKEEYDYNITHLFFKILKIDKLFEINDFEIDKKNNEDNNTYFKKKSDENKEIKERFSINYEEEKCYLNEKQNDDLENIKENSEINDKENTSKQSENVVITEVKEIEKLSNILHHEINTENNMNKNNQINIKQTIKGENVINECNQKSRIYHNNTKEKIEVEKKDIEENMKEETRNINMNNNNNINNNISYSENSQFYCNSMKKKEDTGLNKDNEIFPNRTSLMECKEEDFSINNENKIDLKNIIKSIKEENNIKINLLNDKIKYLKDELIKSKKNLINFENLKNDVEIYKNELNNKNKIIENLINEKNILQDHINIIQSKLDDSKKRNEDNDKLKKYCKENHVDKQIIIELIKNSQDTLKTKNIRNQIFLILCDILGIKSLIEGLQEKTISDQFLEFLEEETKEF
ncbi:conserved Plasmodium protein, unknown function [Plasmodium gallinaceum]|uniref:Uncharacterized protein n=1 Tax=Plasmodium gallinaceum TaxID=5849 RepID=A0A1J1GN25_PLAGA|nr:conserved Plasmodium protein, unknown function [Plasmodium gallinaceum]CRG93834.1 conserved Plasmodium protein, unknown function [Plasmodium gallinaceum]